MKNLNSPWRKTAATIYRKPTDSKIFGSVEIDVTDLEKYIAQKRKEGLKVTLTHIITLATARAIKEEIPEFNTYIKRGNVVSHEQIDATVSVLLEGGVMGSVKLQNADKLTISESVDLMTEEIAKTRKGDENKTMKMKYVLASIPWVFRQKVFNIIRYITTTLGFSFPKWGVSANSFGSFIVSNIGTLGLDIGYPALMPAANISFVMIIGGVDKKPWVVNDEIVVRRILKLGITLDHRLIDASHGGLLFKYIKRIVRNPELLEQKK